MSLNNQAGLRVVHLMQMRRRNWLLKIFQPLWRFANLAKKMSKQHGITGAVPIVQLTVSAIQLFELMRHWGISVVEASACNSGNS